MAWRSVSDRVMVTTGSSGAFLLAFLAAFDAGARIGVIQPGYPAYANILAGSRAKFSRQSKLGRETRFAPTMELIEAAHRRERLDGLLLMSPANPTGAMIAPPELEKICAFCEDAGVVLVSDEIYHRLEYEGRAETALRFSRGAIVVNSFSKYYAMTGWRLGWAIAPASLARPMERLQQSLAICAPTLSQRAALAAFDADEELELHQARLCTQPFAANAPAAANRTAAVRAAGRRLLHLRRRFASDRPIRRGSAGICWRRSASP